MTQTIDANNNGTTPPYRGDIIVDATALIGLRVAIPNTNDGYSEKKYLDILPFLAKNGYRIIVPERVSLEAGDILASGFDVDTLFAGNGKFKEMHAVKSFLKDAALPESSNCKDNPNICIASNTGPKAADDFCSNMEEIVRAKNIELKNFKGSLLRKSQHNVGSNGVERIINSQIHRRIRALRSSENSTDAGDKAIMSLLEEKYNKQNGTPVFVLTDDADLRNKIKSFPHVGVPTVSNLIYGLVGSGLATEFGLPAGIKALDLENARIEALKNIDIDRKEKYNPERIKLGEEQKIAFVNELPLSKSLMSLSNDLKRQKIETPAANETSAGDAVAKFREKYKKSSNGIQR
jgi:hypothetical protein